MKSIAGSIIVLSGALIMGLSFEEIPKEALPTLSSIGLMVAGLIVVITDMKRRE